MARDEEEPILRTRREVQHAMFAYGDSILRFAYTYVHNMKDVSEILRDVLIQYMLYSPDFDTVRDEKKWLLHITALLAEEKLHSPTHNPVDELDEELLRRGENDLAAVWEAMQDLPLEQREAVHLSYIEEYTGKEIAEILGTDNSLVRINLRRGRSSLHEALQEEDDFEKI